MLGIGLPFNTTTEGGEYTMETREDFIKHEISIWGEDYIFDLLERGYVVKLTSDGYKWFYTEPALDKANGVCYAGAVGAS